MFITFEGGEGAGKSTQIKKLEKKLSEQFRKEVVLTREPGATPEGAKIRALLVQRGGGNWTAKSELFLFYVDRIEHVEKLIKPALEEGKIVISDRFSDSTCAYQHYGRGIDADLLNSIQNIAIGSFEPDLTFIMDIEPEVGLGRSTRRLASQSISNEKTEDRFERLEVEFHQKVRQGYLDIARRNPHRCVVIDAAQDMDKVEQDIWAALSQKMGLS